MRHPQRLASFDNLDTIDAFTADDWQNYRDTVVAPNIAPVRPRGQYAATARKAAKSGAAEKGAQEEQKTCPVTGRPALDPAAN